MYIINHGGAVVKLHLYQIRFAASSITNVLHDEHSDTPISQIRLLEDKINVQTKALTHQQFDITNLHKAVFSILDRLDHIASVVTNTSRSPSPPFRPNSLPNYMQQSITRASPIEHTSLPVTDPVPALQQMYHLQETLRDLNNTLQHRNTETDNLKQQLRDARSSLQQPLNNSSTVPLISPNFFFKMRFI